MADYSENNIDLGDDQTYSELRDRAPATGRSQRDFARRKVCKICTGKTSASYKDSEALRRFTTERGKILARRITGTCAKHQRFVAREIKRARILALLPFASK
ncbi:SSU ribosomal protein S18p @ SSU ribosomal protein S18p, zinc-dependent [Olavius algarvensis spirochete endosymbiont]|uniref:30S ribosomal protein S18 n=1 Tax=Olavius algarvensis spirochete endosymbiont TaxID=260710 RepID=UPI00052D4E1C|nr:30S ribosomal protein S18 [Olavius algarvensis spirochete endosymbiont]KGM42667.1 hypothetical protein JY97_12345 [Alkalispirochaeta odontotermitis]VDB00385.1 SSU ribosomal protein S18p @ SSU ribosomal protein S18p, zinc-dependent [Olavius algarvensis spirochete endosymbiont]